MLMTFKRFNSYSIMHEVTYNLNVNQILTLRDEPDDKVFLIHTALFHKDSTYDLFVLRLKEVFFLTEKF